MRRRFSRVHARKAPTKGQQRAALRSLLAMRRTLDGLDRDSLSRSYGLPPDEVERMIRAERARREARDV